MSAEISLYLEVIIKLPPTAPLGGRLNVFPETSGNPQNALMLTSASTSPPLDPSAPHLPRHLSVLSAWARTQHFNRYDTAVGHLGRWRLC